MKNKGFTLIELLAVIVILAIIALIATPIILGIINDARTSASERTAELVKSGVQNAYTGYMMKNGGNTPKTVEDFVNSEFYTVESSEVKADTIESTLATHTNSVLITTSDESLTCTVTGSTTSDKIKIECDGSFPELENASAATGDKTGWTTSKRIYYFTANLTGVPAEGGNGA